jgi:phosphatidate cytidylyltransferase
MTFILRTFSFIILVSLFLFSMLSKSIPAQLLFAVFAITSAFFVVYETFSMIEKINKPGFKAVTSTVAALMILFMAFYEIQIMMFLIAIVFLVAGMWVFMLFVYEDRDKYVDKAVNSLGVFMMVAVPLSFLVLIYRVDPLLLLFMVAVTKIGDTGAYVFGSLSNKLLGGKNHKVVPRISPNKSYEGVIGGLVCSVLLSFALAQYVFDPVSLNPAIESLDKHTIHFALMVGIVLFFGGFAGDLAESVLKRTCGVKDSGNTIPGMGGFFDFLDSLMLNAPLFYLYLLYFDV